MKCKLGLCRGYGGLHEVDRVPRKTGEEMYTHIYIHMLLPTYTYIDTYIHLVYKRKEFLNSKR